MSAWNLRGHSSKDCPCSQRSCFRNYGQNSDGGWTLSKGLLPTRDRWSQRVGFEPSVHSNLTLQTAKPLWLALSVNVSSPFSTYFISTAIHFVLRDRQPVASTASSDGPNCRNCKGIPVARCRKIADGFRAVISVLGTRLTVTRLVSRDPSSFFEESEVNSRRLPLTNTNVACVMCTDVQDHSEN